MIQCFRAERQTEKMHNKWSKRKVFWAVNDLMFSHQKRSLTLHSQMCWAHVIWYVFCQIYTGEHDVDKSFQPMPMTIPGLLPISPTDGYFQPRTLKDICADHVYKHAGKYWSMGPDVTGCKNVSSIVHFVRHREVTGSTQVARAAMEMTYSNSKHTGG